MLEAMSMHGCNNTALPCRAFTVACRTVHEPLLNTAAHESLLWLC